MGCSNYVNQCTRLSRYSCWHCYDLFKTIPQENIFEFFIVQIITISVSKDDSFLIFNQTST